MTVAPSRLPPDLLALKSTTRALIDACGGSVACGVILDKSNSLIRSYANPNVPDRFMPLDDVMALERFAGRAIVSAWGVERHKGDPDRKRRAPSLDALDDMIREGADAKSALIAFTSGPRDAAARARLGRALRDVIELYSQLADDVEEA